MIVLSWMNDEGNLAAANGTTALERSVFEIRHVFRHQGRHHLTRARILTLELVGVTLGAPWLVKEGFTIGSLSFALFELIWIHDIHAVIPTVVRVLNGGILVVAIWSQAGFG